MSDVDVDEEEPKVETRGQMTQRHKRELSNLKKVTAKMGKKKKDEAGALEAELKAAHEKQVAELDAREAGAPPAAEPDATEALPAAVSTLTLERASEEEADQQPTGGNFGGGKKSKAQKKREKKQAEEAEREARIAEEKLSMGPSDKELEERALRSVVVPLGLMVKDIQADGHCLYRSVEDQLRCTTSASQQPQAHDFLELRRMAAAHMRCHPDDFMPFLEDCPSVDHFQAYCDQVENSAEWGGQLELQALAFSLKRTIRVCCADLPLVEVGSEYIDDGEPLYVAYLRHAYGLGEHYNSLVKLPTRAQDE